MTRGMEVGEVQTQTVKGNGRYAMLWRALSVAVFAGFIALVQGVVGWRTLLAPWKSAPLRSLLPAMLLVLGSYVTRAARLHDYLHLGARGSFRWCFKLTLQHNLCNNFLPARTGEVSFPVLMSRYFAVPVWRSVGMLVWFRMLDMLVLCGGALLFAGSLWMPPALSVPIGALLVFSPWLAFRCSAALRRWNTGSGRIKRILQRVLDGLPRSRREFWGVWGWTVLNWGVKVSAFAWVLRLFSGVSYRTATLGVVCGDFTSVLPFHGVAGAGSYEAGVVAGLTPAGLPLHTALAAAVDLHLLVLGATLVGGVLSLALRGQPAVQLQRAASTPRPQSGAPYSCLTRDQVDGVTPTVHGSGPHPVQKHGTVPFR